MILRTFTAAAVMAISLAGCASTGSYGDGDYYDRSYSSRYGQYDWDRSDPRYNGYYPERYYRSDRRYQERRLSESDRIYRGRNGRYYCRRSDGSTGLIVGAVVGGVLGNVIAKGRSETLGTVLGAIGGAAVGAAIDSGREVRCR